MTKILSGGHPQATQGVQLNAPTVPLHTPVVKLPPLGSWVLGLTQVEILNAAGAYGPVPEGTVLAEAELFGVVPYFFANTGCSPAPPDIRE